MAEQQNKRYFNKRKSRNIEQTTKEVKILNIEPNKLQDTDVKTLILNFGLAADAFKRAVKNLKIDNYDNELQKKEIIKVLSDMQNMIKLKILSLKRGQRTELEEESSRTQNADCSPHSSAHSLFSFLSEFSSKNSPDKESEAFKTSKLMSLSKQSLYSIKSSQTDYSTDQDHDHDDYGDDGYSDEKFKEFLVKINCPFCLKHEDNKNSLVKHLDTACTVFKNKTFVKSSDCPYSTFQILGNDTFKCNICPNSVQSNLKRYFAHSQSANHISTYKKVASLKNYTELIFCSACKIQIPNNATQILFHTKHEVHKRNGKDQRSTTFYRQKGIQCIYSKEKKFKCLHCPPGTAVHKSVKEILLHLDTVTHVNLLRNKNFPQKAVYCLFCLAEVRASNVIAHFSSSRHTQKEVEEEEENEFQLCYYCGFQCSNLHTLALHTEGCSALDVIRQEDNRQVHEEFLGVATSIKKDQKGPTNENNNKKGQCIIVKDYHKTLELYNYFKQFGKVLEIEASGENTVVIKFQEKKTVDEILESQKPIEINGVKLKIIRKENFDDSGKILETSRRAESTNSCPVASNDGSDPSPAGRNVADVSNSSVHEDFSEVLVDGGALGSLFDRVSTHLLHTVLKPDCKDVLNIALDCEQILKLGKCHSVGFLNCGLTFPVEKITLYCELSSFIKEQCLDDNSKSLTESVLFNETLCKKCINLFKNAEGVSEVSLSENSFPLVEFYHKKSQKFCTITFRQSEKILADELRYCLKDNKKLRSFVLIVRFWLSVRKLVIREFESVIISLLLFFLLRSGVVNTFSENFRRTPGHVVLNNAITRLDQGCVGNNQNTEPAAIPKHMKIQEENLVQELFQKFLVFLNEFDFENMAICLPLLYPVPKTKLLQDDLRKFLFKLDIVNSPICIMDPFLFNNLAKDVKKADWDSFLKTVRETVENNRNR